MKQPRLNEEGIAYQILSIGVGFVGAAIVLIVFSPVLQFFNNFANSLIGSSTITISAQTMGTFGFILGMFAMAPVIIIGGFLIGGYLDAVAEKDRAGGGML
jgi:hypothetical protein